MRFADSLRDYDPNAGLEVRRAEALERIVSCAEEAVKHDSTAAARQGLKKISGFLGLCSGYDTDPYHSLLGAEDDGLIRIDRVTAQYTYEVVSPYSSPPDPIPLTAQEIEYILSSVRDRIGRLGFYDHSVSAQQQTFFKKEQARSFFGKIKTKQIPDGAGLLLKIEVSW